MSEPPATLSPLKRAYLAIEQLQAKLQALDRTRPEPIAIIGIGCRFPGDADTPASFWQLLHEGADAIDDVPSTRWTIGTPAIAEAHAAGTVVPRSGGFLKDVDRFDPEFFGISPREAISLDPQQRLLLEVGWEALERAGRAKNRLAENQTGVFIGITSHDYAQLQGATGGTAEFDAYHITGNALNAAAGRLSYAFGFQGPCIAIDTACSSSLVAVHLACRSLSSGECSLALAGGVNLILSPIASIALSRARVLSPDGRCKAFDAAADGMGRGEGCGVVVLKRLSDAIKDRDHIVAVIAGSAVNQDGPSSGLTVPNGPAQEALIRQALASAKTSPDHVDYIEAHGTGTALGDPVEFGALTAVFGSGRSPDRPLLVGSVKSNIGHSEAAAGIAGLIKAALALSHSEIPSHLHFRRPSPLIRWSEAPIEIVTAPVRWPAGPGKKTAGVSAFGFTGTNAHVVLQEAPEAGMERPEAIQSRPLQLLVLSGRSIGALKKLAARYEEHLRVPGSVRLEDVCYTASTGRGHFEHRIAIHARSAIEMKDALGAFRDDRPEGIAAGHSDAQPSVAWVFGDDCREAPGLGQATRETEPLFQKSLDRCNSILRVSLEQPLFDVLDQTGAEISETLHRHTRLFALQYAFAQLWRAWGLVPSAVIGAGVGEYAAAAIAEVLSLEDALRLVIARARLLPEHGQSSAASDLVQTFRSSAAGIQYRPPRIRLFTRSGGFESTQVETAAHWVNEFCRQVSRSSHSSDWPEFGYDVLCEIGPASVQSPGGGTFLRGLTTASHECRQLLGMLGELYVRGAEVEWPAFWRDRPGRQVDLPTYPFDRQRYWIAPEPTENRASRFTLAAIPPEHPLLGERLRLAGTTDLRFESRINPSSPAFLEDHRVFGQTVFPAAAYIELALAANRTANRKSGNPTKGEWNRTELRDISFQRPLILSAHTDTTVQILLTDEGPDERGFQVFSRQEDDDEERWLLHCSGQVRSIGVTGAAAGPDLESRQQAITDVVRPDDLYEQCRLRGIDLGPRFQALKHLRRRDGEALGLARLPSGAVSDDPYEFHPVLLDGCLQVLGAAGREGGKESVYLPLTLGRLQLLRRPAAALWSHARIRPVHSPDPQNLTVDFWLFSDEGHLVATLDGLQLQRASAEQVRRSAGVEHDWLYEVQWHAQPQSHDLQWADRVALFPAVCADAQRTVAATGVPAEPDAYQRVIRELEDLSALYAVQTLRTLGCAFSTGQCFTLATLARNLRIPDRHHRQLSRLLEMFVEDGWLTPDREAWQVTASPAWRDPDERSRQLALRFPAAQNEVQMLRRCGAGLVDVFRGLSDPLDLLFPEGEAVTAASLYQDSPGARAANGAIERIFTAYLERVPTGRRLRVLEVGAGTGGTTACLLSHLAHRQVDYTFTDLSAAFLNRARQRFSSYDFVHYRTFDVEMPPSEQGFPAGAFDIVLAANVLHATRDLQESLRHIRSVLAPGGMLVLLEGVAPLRFIDLIFGMTDGWWRFTDLTVRQKHPLVSRHQWRELMERSGFEDSTVVTPEGPGFFASQAVILSLAGQRSVSAGSAERWVVFADRQGVGERLAEQLASAGAAVCALVTASHSYEVNGRAFSVDPDNPDHYQRVLDQVAHTAGGPLRGIVHLWALDATEPADAATVRAAAQLECGSVLHLVQAVARTGRESPPALILVTRGAQPVGEHRPRSGLFQSPLLGMGKAIALEHPEFTCLGIDLDPADLDPSSLARSILGELRLTGREGQVAYREQNRYVARLARRPVHGQGESLPLQFHSEATYLITGGLSGLGLRVAHWMAARGARHLALIARSEIDEGGRAELNRFHDRGVTATFYRADASDFEQLDRVLRQLSDSALPLRGIIHSAGVLADGSLLHQTWDRFERVLKPKVDGAWNLHTLTLDQPLDFFVLFSSAASMLGSPAQANHSAANAFLDALAAFRLAQGLPGLSINWGPWSDIGSAAAPALGARLATHGIGTMTPEQGLRVLEYLMSQSDPQVGVIPLQWESLLSQFPAAGMEPPFFSVIASAERARVSRNIHVAPDRLSSLRADASRAERSVWLQGYLTEQVARSLQLSSAQVSPTKPLNHMGLDSLMAIEIRNRIKRDLAVDVPAVRFLEGVTVAGLASDLAETVGTAAMGTLRSDSTESASVVDANLRGTSSQEITPAVASHLLSRMDELTNDQVEALLAAVATPRPRREEAGTRETASNRDAGRL